MSARADKVPRTVAFPLALRPNGLTRTDDDRHAVVRQLLEQLLFTNPGERVNRPTLGCGLMRDVFAARDEHLVTATRYQVKAEIEKWLGDVLRNVSVVVEGERSSLEILVGYQLLDEAGVTTVRFSR